MEYEELIDRVINRMIDQNAPAWALNIEYFDWVPGVGLYGIYKAWKYTKKAKYLEYLEKWIDRHLVEAYETKTVNSTAPLLTVLGMYEELKKENYLDVCLDIGNWIVREAPKTKEGGFEHTVTEAGADFSEQIWADTLFMVCIFLAKLGRLTGDTVYSREACKQLEIHHKVLKERFSGLFYHGWNCKTENWMSGALWGRANAWIVISTVEILENLPEQFEGRRKIIESLHNQVSALDKVQKNNGMFTTLLDDPDSYEETSATAGIGYGIKKGIRLGYISKEYLSIVKKTEQAVMKKINEKGEVLGVSSGTPIMPVLEAYKKIAIKPTLYGQGLTLMMLSENRTLSSCS